MDKATIIEEFRLFTFGPEPGIGRWLSEDIHNLVLESLVELERTLLTKVQLNQLLVVSRAASISDGFFRYYWRTAPDHPYDVQSVEGCEKDWVEPGEQVILSLDHLRWGLYRIYTDAIRRRRQYRGGTSPSESRGQFRPLHRALTAVKDHSRAPGV